MKSTWGSLRLKRKCSEPAKCEEMDVKRRMLNGVYHLGINKELFRSLLWAAKLFPILLDQVPFNGLIKHIMGVCRYMWPRDARGIEQRCFMT